MQDSFTTQDCTHYSTAPFNWVTDTNIIGTVSYSNTTPGLFVKSDNPLSDIIDKESNLAGLGNVIGRCENVDVNALNKAKELSIGLQQIYKVDTKDENQKQMFMNNTRLTQPEESITETSFNRWEFLPYNHQETKNIIQDNRGGTWSRNEFKDNYTCPIADSRGGNR